MSCKLLMRQTSNESRRLSWLFLGKEGSAVARFMHFVSGLVNEVLLDECASRKNRVPVPRWKIASQWQKTLPRFRGEVTSARLLVRGLVATTDSCLHPLSMSVVYSSDTTCRSMVGNKLYAALLTRGWRASLGGCCCVSVDNWNGCCRR